MLQGPDPHPEVPMQRLSDQIYAALCARGLVIPQTQEDVLRAEGSMAVEPVDYPYNEDTERD